MDKRDVRHALYILCRDNAEVRRIVDRYVNVRNDEHVTGHKAGDVVKIGELVREYDAKVGNNLLAMFAEGGEHWVSDWKLGMHVKNVVRQQGVAIRRHKPDSNSSDNNPD